MPSSLDPPLVYPAYDHLLKCSHTFNLLDARGVISVAERNRYILRTRRLAMRIAKAYLARREELDFPLGSASREAAEVSR